VRLCKDTGKRREHVVLEVRATTGRQVGYGAAQHLERSFDAQRP
jgi:hypothetical protein